MSAGAAGRPGEPVHAGEQSVVPSGRLHAAGLRDHAARSVHPLRQRRVVRTCNIRVQTLMRNTLLT